MKSLSRWLGFIALLLSVASGLCNAFFLVSFISFIIGFIIFFYLLVEKHNKEKKEMLKKYYPTFSMNAENVIHYQRGLEYLEEIKSSQWNLTYYCILLFGAIIGLSLIKSIQKVQNIEFNLLMIAIIVLGTGIYLMVEHQFILRQTRIAILKHESLFRSAHYWMCNTKYEKLKIEKKSFFYDSSVFLLFIGAAIIGFLCVLYILFETINPLKIFRL